MVKYFLQVWLALEQMCQALGQMDMEEREMDASSNDDNKVSCILHVTCILL